MPGSITSLPPPGNATSSARAVCLEADCLVGDVLVSFLRQLRDGYVNRDMFPFPKSIALVGMLDVRDYKVQIRPDGQSLGEISPFNIIRKDMLIPNFTEADIAARPAHRRAADFRRQVRAGLQRRRLPLCDRPRTASRRSRRARPGEPHVCRNHRTLPIARRTGRDDTERPRNPVGEGRRARHGRAGCR